MRKLDHELLKFKLELEADNRGITEILEKHSLEMDQPGLGAGGNNLKENRHPKKHVNIYLMPDILWDIYSSIVAELNDYLNVIDNNLFLPYYTERGENIFMVYQLRILEDLR